MKIENKIKGDYKFVNGQFSVLIKSGDEILENTNMFFNTEEKLKNDVIEFIKTLDITNKIEQINLFYDRNESKYIFLLYDNNKIEIGQAIIEFQI